MTRLGRAPALALGVAAPICALVLTACGGHPTAVGPPAPTSSGAGTETTRPNPGTPGHATAVSVIREGGLKGGRVKWTFTRGGAPPAGHTDADVRRALRAASAPQLARVDLPTPASSCCDRYRFLITIRYANGSTKRFSTVDGEPWPPVFRVLVRAVG